MATELKNKVAIRLQNAIATAPFLLEKERYEVAIAEINRLQSIIDSYEQAKSQEQQDNEENISVVYNGHVWHADEDNYTVRFMRGHFQVFKAPKQGTDYAEYWPSSDMIKWMLDTLNSAELSGNPPSVLC